MIIMGPMVGGPWDGEEHSAVGRDLECLFFSMKCPDGAVYEWDGSAWRYAGIPAPNAFSTLLKAINPSA